MKWTKEQQAAIDTRECDLLVAAAAGSGKTAVLIERIIKIITDKKNPIDIDRLLVVTFTNAAAAEMRERLGEAISKKIEEDPKNIHLQKQLTLLHRASISTIHAFCLNVIRTHFHLLDLDPSFRIADESEILLIKTDIMEEVFEDFYKEGNEDFYALVESYGGKKEDTTLQGILLNLYNFVQSNPWPETWLNEKVELFNSNNTIDFNETIWAKMIKEQIKQETKGLMEIARQALALSMRPNGPDKYIAAIQDDMGGLKRIIDLCNEKIEDLYYYIHQISFPSLGRCSKEIDENLKEEVSKLRNMIKDGIRNDFQKKILLKSPKEMKQDIHEIYPIMKALEEVLIEFLKRFQLAKKDKGLIDFNDIEHYCLNILLDKGSNMSAIKPSQVAFELQEKYQEILIDEYQDSNLVQETILEVISGKYSSNPNRFMVGDVKQSIYRFRLAKPDLFIEKYNSFSAEKKGKEQRIDLFKNFRSRESILNGVNYIFRQIMTPDLGEIEYDDKAALNCGVKYPEEGEFNTGGSIELHLIESNAFNDEVEEVQEELENISNIELEAKIVARRIKKIINEDSYSIYDKNIQNYRKADYKDIVILLRTTSNWSNIFMDELSKEGIPSYADVSSGYFDAIEVRTILSLLRIIDNPRQDIPFITVLRSPIVGLSCDDLVEIRSSFTYGDYYESVQRYIEESFEETELINKLKKFMSHLIKWRREVAHIPIDELLWTLYTETNYYNYLGAMPGGEQRQANLSILRDRAAGYEATSFKGLFNFIRFIEKMQIKKGDMGAAKIVGENENIVRIMSIHKSKGLEFPIVFVSGLGKQFNLKDLHEPILLHQDLGLGPDYIDYKRRISYDTAAKVAIKRKIKIETLSEEMRILYVALTRAKEKLILTGTLKNIEDSAKNWVRQVDSMKEEISPYILSKSRTFLDWIGFGLARHKDGEVIRTWGNCLKMPMKSLYEDESSWKIISWSIQDIIIKDETKKKEKEEVVHELLNWDYEKVYSPFRKEIFERLSWKYPYEIATNLSVKVSVSEIKSQYEQNYKEYQSTSLYPATLPQRPRFVEGKQGFTGTEKGTIIHTVMRHLDFRAKEYKDIENQLLDMEIKGLLTEEERKTIYIPSLLNFCKSEMARRITDASLVKKEIPFILALNAQEIYKDLNSPEEVFIQGIIDCYFEEEDGVVLIDYKTDFIQDKENPEDEIKKIMDKYKIQINIYTKALEEITGKKVKESCLYLFGVSKVMFY